MRWTPAQVLVSSMLGGPLAGFMLLAMQARATVDGRCSGATARAHLTMGAIAQGVLLLVGLFAPEGFPRGGIAAAGIVVPWSLARRATAVPGAGRRALGWMRVLALGAACGFATILAGVSLSVLGRLLVLSRG